MTITTKYNIGDKAWMLLLGIPEEVEITGIKYTLRGIFVICKFYTIYTSIGSEFEIPEDLLYPTKEKLLKTL